MTYKIDFKNRMVRNGNSSDTEMPSIELSQWGRTEAQVTLKNLCLQQQLHKSTEQPPRGSPSYLKANWQSLWLCAPHRQSPLKLQPGLSCYIPWHNLEQPPTEKGAIPASSAKWKVMSAGGFPAAGSRTPLPSK